MTRLACINDVRADELPVLVALWSASWQKAVPDIDFVAREAWFSAYLPGLVAAGARLRVARAADGAALGFVTIDPASGYLDTLVVSAPEWGSGIANALLDEARRLSPQGVDLKVNQLNARAIRFYEKQGFTRGAGGVNPLSGQPLWHYHWRADRTAS